MSVGRATALVAGGVLVTAAAAVAHPAVDVVIDSRGTVFYSDLEQVWMVATDGTRTVAVPGVHTHELYVDADDTLYGEHLWYEGEAADRWGHRVWKRTRDGRIGDVIPATEGFRSTYSFDRDRAGNHYFPFAPAGEGSSPRTEVRRRGADGVVTVVARGFTAIGWMHAAADGTLLVLDSPSVKRVASDGTVTTLVADANRRTLPSLFGSRHDLQGVWPGRAGEAYVARNRTGEVLRIAGDGHLAVAARSPAGWAPTGGVVAPDGTLWVLEYSTFNAARLRRVAADGRSGTFP